MSAEFSRTSHTCGCSGTGMRKQLGGWYLKPESLLHGSGKKICHCACSFPLLWSQVFFQCTLFVCTLLSVTEQTQT